MAVHQHSGSPVSSSHKLSSRVLDKTMQESMPLLLMSCHMISKSMMKLSPKTSLKNQSMESSAMVSTSRAPDGTKQRTCLMSPSQSSCMLSCHLFGLFQREIGRSQLPEFMIFQCTRFFRELVPCLQQVTQPTSCNTWSFQPRKSRRNGSEVVLLASWHSDIDHI